MANSLTELYTPFKNQSLFSDYYLQHRLLEQAEWAEDISTPWKRLKTIYQGQRHVLSGLNEAQTDDSFIRPVLEEVLGFAYIPQTAFKRQGVTNRPDYSLFKSQEEKAEAQKLIRDQEKFYRRVLAICDAKYWGRNLDVKSPDDARDTYKNTNPSFQIINYLIGTQVDWGILTNGKLWRLYYQQAHSRATNYYEVDLEAILETDDIEAFRYFYHFFRKPAYLPDPTTGRTFLEQVYEGSTAYAVEVGARLKDLIFEEIFIYLARGVIEYRRQERVTDPRVITAESSETLQQIYTATLTLLYRLLFLLYAESRDLLPVSDQHGYYQYSLTRIKNDIAGHLDQGHALSRVSDNWWNDLAALFKIIDRGDPGLNVPTYNGGLFSGKEDSHRFLQENRISDFWLAKAIDLLTRECDPRTGEHKFIDYKSLGVRQLGSIY